MTALRSSAPVRVVARVLAQPDKIPMAGKILQTLMIQSRRESGCLQYDVLQNRDDPADFTTVEHWQDQTRLDRHFQTPHFAWWLARANTIAEFQGWHPFIATQLEWSLVERSAEPEFMPLSAELDIGLVSWSALAGGMTTGKYNRPVDANELYRLKDHVDPEQNLFWSAATKRNLAIMEEVVKIAAEVRSPLRPGEPALVDATAGGQYSRFLGPHPGPSPGRPRRLRV